MTVLRAVMGTMHGWRVMLEMILFWEALAMTNFGVTKVTIALMEA